MPHTPKVSRRAALAGGAALLAAPALSQGQPDAVRIGHLTPRTGFLGPLGEYAVQAVQLAAEEINAAGGIAGRRLELLLEDSVNPQTASAKAERYVQRDRVACIVGEINSASALAIAQVVQREKALFVNTGANSDALRGSDCRRFMFHIEGANTMYVKSVGRALVADGRVRGKKYYALTEARPGQTVLVLGANGGAPVGEDLIPTELTDFSPFLLKLRQARPDIVIANLAGAQITNFLKQYSEFGLTYAVAGFGFDTALAWGAGQGNFLGTWPVVWHHQVDTPSARAFVAGFQRKWNRMPENQAWGDYCALKIIAQSMNELKSVNAGDVVAHLERGAKFDLLKGREGYFRARDHQIMMEMYALTALPADKVRNRWDIFTASAPVPAPDEGLEAIASTAEENACTFPA